MKELTGEWINKAEGDFLVAEREMKSANPVYDAVCFHSQQCVEKYLKAILQENDIDFAKTHDLDLLLGECVKHLPQLGESAQELIELSGFAVEIRYPGTEATDQDGQNCIATAIKIRRLIRNHFNINFER